MQEATYLILTALAAGSQHRYGIIGDVAQISGDRVRLRPGPCTRALDRLARRAGWWWATARRSPRAGCAATTAAPTARPGSPRRRTARRTPEPAALRRLRGRSGRRPGLGERAAQHEGGAFPSWSGGTRLLACYPRAFRRGSSEEILAVLLDCAQDGQRRPGCAASADLIRGAVRMRLRLAGHPPGRADGDPADVRGPGRAGGHADHPRSDGQPGPPGSRPPVPGPGPGSSTVEPCPTADGLHQRRGGHRRVAGADPGARPRPRRAQVHRCGRPRRDEPEPARRDSPGSSPFARPAYIAGVAAWLHRPGRDRVPVHRGIQPLPPRARAR